MPNSEPGDHPPPTNAHPPPSSRPRAASFSRIHCVTTAASSELNLSKQSRARRANNQASVVIRASSTLSADSPSSLACTHDAPEKTQLSVRFHTSPHTPLPAPLLQDGHLPNKAPRHLCHSASINLRRVYLHTPISAHARMLGRRVDPAPVTPRTSSSYTIAATFLSASVELGWIFTVCMHATAVSNLFPAPTPHAGR